MELYTVDGAVPAELLEQIVEEFIRNPSHPGALLADTFENKSLDVPEAARRIGVPRDELDRVLEGQAPLTPELALRLEAAGWSNAESWLRLQSKYDLAQARQALAAA